MPICALCACCKECVRATARNAAHTCRGDRERKLGFAALDVFVVLGASLPQGE